MGEDTKMYTKGVPVVDVSAIVRELGSMSACGIEKEDLSAEANETVQKLHDVMSAGSGGFIAVNHGFDREVEGVIKGANKFHRSMKEIKESYAKSMYNAPGEVKIATRPASLHERLAYPRVVYESDAVDPSLIKFSKREAIMANDPLLFDMPGVDDAFREFQKCIRSLTLALLRGMAISLGLSPNHFDSGWALSNSGVTSLHYLPLIDSNSAPKSDGYFGQGNSTIGDGIDDLGASMRAYPHADGDSMLTLLVHDEVEGLQVLERGKTPDDDEWISVPRASSTQIVVQIGMMTQRLTNDEYYATPHRVLRPLTPAPARTTLAYFFRPGFQMELKVPDRLQRPNDNGEIYETVTVETFLGMPRTDAKGDALKISSNILKDGRWVGARPGAVKVIGVHEYNKYL